MILADDPQRPTQAARAAGLTAAAVRFAFRALSGTVGPLYAGRTPMDTFQFSRMFAATRIPEPGRDRLHKRTPDGTRYGLRR